MSATGKKKMLDAGTPLHRAVICGYADNEAHPNISGELRLWDIQTARYSDPQYFDSAISSLGSTDEGTVIAGTEHGEVSSWRFDAGWHRSAVVKHPVAVLAVAHAAGGRLACSVSRDGLLVVWDMHEGRPLLRTFVDHEPVGVGFLRGGRRLCMVDRSGEVHLWEVEEFDRLSVATHEGADSSGDASTLPVARCCLDAAAHLGTFEELLDRREWDAAGALLETLPEMPGREDVRRFWESKLESARA